MAGKKRSRKSTTSSSTVKRERRQPQPTKSAPSASGGAEEAFEADPADYADHSAAAKPQRKKKKKRRDNAAIGGDGHDDGVDDEGGTAAVPKRRKAKDSEERSTERQAGGQTRATLRQKEGNAQGGREHARRAPTAGGFAHGEIVRHISQFLSRKPHAAAEASEADADSEECVSNGGSQRGEKPSDSISYLVEFLEAGASCRGDDGSAIIPPESPDTVENVAADVIVTREDVASLLLPWAVARLMRSAGASSSSPSDAMDGLDEVAWRALSSCLDVLSSQKECKADGAAAEGGEGGATTAGGDADASCEALLSASLSQGALNRLVPYAAKVSFVSASVCTTGTGTMWPGVQRYASNCFLHLARRFRPSLDNACNSLLLDVDALVSSSTGSDSTDDGNNTDQDQYVLLPTHQANVVSSTLQMIHSLMSDANPKRLFSTVCSREVLPRVGRMNMVVSNLSAGDADKGPGATTIPSARLLVRDILWDGLLDPAHHVDGFRTMSELHDVPPLPQLDPGDADRTTSEKDPPKGSSKGKGGGKTCFQSNLFASLRSLLSLPAIDSGEGGEEAVRDAAATAGILPVIVHGFFERIRAGATGGSTTEADARLQFRFWCRIMLPALELLFRTNRRRLPSDKGGEEGGATLALLGATSETLGLVLAFDAYLPSYGDSEERHLTYLERATKGLLRYVTGNDSLEELASPLTDQEICALETSFCHVIQLNHRLLHEKLVNVIAFACSRLPSSQLQVQPGQNTKAHELLFSIVKIYRELRQVGYFLKSTRGAFAAGFASHQSAPMKNLLHCGHILDSLSLAYQSCPSGQLHEIWEFFDGWIVDIVGQKVGDGVAGGATAELSFAVRMFAVFVKNIRADKQNSPELRGLCEKSMTTSVSAMLGKKTDGVTSPDISTDSKGNHVVLMQHGFDLCGWLVDLHTRSCFWIEDLDVDGRGSFFLLRGNDDANELNVLSYLRNTAKAAVSSDKFRTWKASWLQTYWQSTMDSNCLEKFRDIGIPLSLRGSLQRLALHRIHQLHSMIYYCNLRENEEHASDLEEGLSSSQALTDEARMLVNFSLYIACSQIKRQSSARDTTGESHLPESLWSPIAQSLSTWIHYSDPFHTELFLIWFFSAFCQNQPDALSSKLFGLEKTIALTLARDASFYDVSEAMSSFMKVGIQFAFSRFIDSIETTCKPSKTMYQESTGLTDSCMELAETGDAKLLSPDNNVDNVSTALSFLASVPLEFTSSNENLNLLDRVLGFAIVSSQVIKRAMDESECGNPRLLNIVRSTKIIIANVLPKTLLLCSDFDAPCLVNMTSQLSKSCFDFRFDDGVVSATGDTISEYFSMCIEYHEKNASMLATFFTQMSTVVHDAADVEFASNASLIRSVIRRMNILDRHHSLSKKTVSANTSSYELCMKFVQETQKHLQSKMFQHIAKGNISNIPEDDKVASVALLLASETYYFIGNQLDTLPERCLLTSEQLIDYRENVQKVFKLIEDVPGSQHGSEFIEASNYFLSSIVTSPGYFLQCVQPLSICKNILDALAHSFSIGQESPLLDAAICSLIRNSDLEHTKTITAHVLREADGARRHDTSFIIKIFHLLMVCANCQEQHKYIECKTFLAISMGLLRERKCARYRLVSNVKLFSKTMTTLVSKKELLLLSGREIAMIICEMNALFYDDGANQNLVDGDMVIFNSCCAVVSSLIAHYPKQLYGCPSPLFSLLLALLTHLLHSKHPKKTLSQKTLEYAKVCELLIPHKDIFKKHVVGLILCFIQTLNTGMNPAIKSRLMPSIYALLDMCSDFETRQINAMIDVPSKTLFAPVFQSYRKFYQYHGQA